MMRRASSQKRNRLEAFKQEKIIATSLKKSSGSDVKDSKAIDLLSDDENEDDSKKTKKGKLEFDLFEDEDDDDDEDEMPLSQEGSVFASALVSKQLASKEAERAEEERKRRLIAARDARLRNELEETESAITIKLLNSLTQDVLHVKANPRDRCGVLVKKVCELLRVSMDDVKFYFDGLELDAEETIEQSSIMDGDEVEIRATEEFHLRQLELRVEAELDKGKMLIEDEADGITCRVRDAAGRSIELNLPASACMADVIDKYKAAFPETESVKLGVKFDGDWQDDQVTFADAGIENDDLLDVEQRK